MTNLTVNDCELCNSDGGHILWREPLCRVVSVAEPGYPGFCRVILNQHVAEATDLNDNDRTRVMQVVFAVESALRQQMNPTKINLASLGNRAPHLHWHVIPRYADDSHFPDTIWAPPRRSSTPRQAPSSQRLAQALRTALE